MDQPADAEAELSFLTTAEGGRATPARSGYRPACDFKMEDGWNDAILEFMNQEWASPGETVATKIHFFSPDLQTGRLYEGFEFTAHEGLKVVARGRITKLLNDALRKKL